VTKVIADRGGGNSKAPVRAPIWRSSGIGDSTMNAFGRVLIAAALAAAGGALAGCAVVPAGPAYTVAPAPVYVAPAPFYIGPTYWHGGCCYGHRRR
jgi:hypothetical protein